MRIVHVANFYGPRSGGIRTTMHALASGYAEHGHEAVLVVPGPTSGLTTHGGTRVVTVAAPRVPRTGGYRLVLRPSVVRDVLSRLAPDRLEVSDRTTLLALGDWARHHGVPSTLLLHERLDGVLRAFVPGLPVAALRGFADRYNTATLPRFDRLVATTAFAAAEAERVGGACGLPRVHRVPLGVDLDQFHPQRHDPAERARLARDHEAVVLVVSRLSAEKRVDLAVDAAAHLGRDGRPVRLVVAGAGPQLTRLRARAEQAGVRHRFLSFVSSRDGLATLLACADVVVAPGPVETFGLAALEALASGTPTVVSSTSALPEVVADAGVAAPPTPRALADALHTVLDRPVAERRADARARAEELPWHATVTGLLTVHGRAAFTDTPAVRVGASR